MNPYKVQYPQTARALADYWQNAYGVECTVKPFDGWVEVMPKHPEQYAQGRSGPAIQMWRNICDAFIAGRTSVVN
jgi:hypothetical protein